MKQAWLVLRSASSMHHPALADYYIVKNPTSTRTTDAERPANPELESLSVAVMNFAFGPK
jgi:hypothetical protein